MSGLRPANKHISQEINFKQLIGIVLSIYDTRLMRELRNGKMVEYVNAICTPLPSVQPTFKKIEDIDMKPSGELSDYNDIIDPNEILEAQLAESQDYIEDLDEDIDNQTDN